MKKLIFNLAIIIGSITSIAAESRSTIEIVDDVVQYSNSAVETVYTDGKDAVSTIYSDGKGIIQEIYPDIKMAIVEIADSIGVASEQVYQVLVKQQVVRGITSLLFVLIGSVLLIYSIRLFNKLLVAPDVRIITPIILLLASFGLLISVNYLEMMTGLINPDYGAITYIIEYAKDLIK